MAQISLMAYCIAGAALSLEFWEGPWLMFVMLARLRQEVADSLIKSKNADHIPQKWYNKEASHGMIDGNGAIPGAKPS
jgi:hypothetical protein